LNRHLWKPELLQHRHYHLLLYPQQILTAYPLPLVKKNKRKRNGSSENESLRKKEAKLAITAVKNPRVKPFDENSDEKTTSLSLLATTRMTTNLDENNVRVSVEEANVFVNRQKLPNTSLILAKRASRLAMP